MNTPSRRWHAITCRSCGETLAAGLMPPGSEQVMTFVWAFQHAHRTVDGCPADHLVLAPCTEAEAIAVFAAGQRETWAP